MSQPPPYLRYQDFSDYQAANPDTPFPGSIIDTELDRIKATADAICTNLALIQRDDGLLANGSVHPDALNSAVLSMLAGWNPRGDWVTATAYVNSSTQKDLVRQSGVSYVCLVSHTSGTFATDLAAGKWQTLGQVGDASSITFTPTGDIAAATVALALAELDTEKQPKDATLTALAGGATGANKLFYWSGVDTVAVADLTAAGRALLDDANAAAQRATLGLGTLAVKNTVASGDFDAGAVATADMADDAVTLAQMGHGTQGDIIIFGASGAPAYLAAGTNGYKLKTQGAAANPVWAMDTVVQSEITTSVASSTVTTAIPWDDTIPQNTEGTQTGNLSITPTSATNYLVIDVQIVVAYTPNNANDALTVALFQDSTANAIGAVWHAPSAAALESRVVRFTHYMLAGTTSSTTFKVRIGTNEGTTITINGSGGSRKMGGITQTVIAIKEVAP